MAVQESAARCAGSAIFLLVDPRAFAPGLFFAAASRLVDADCPGDQIGMNMKQNAK